MQADFPLPKQAEDAKNEAFSRIREMAADFWKCGKCREYGAKITGEINRKINKEINRKFRKEIQQETAKSHKKFKAVYKTALGLTAAAAVFSTVCITNPAFAENIPLVGNVFKQLGNSHGILW